MKSEEVKLRVATGRSRKETAWKNKTITWQALVERLSSSHRSAYTLEQYKALDKDKQAEIKDVGGFVGGYLTGGRRKPENVQERWLVTLDQDFAVRSDGWADYEILYGYAAVRYSTHKHSAEEPRYRWVIPCDRAVARDEYEPLARAVAAWLDINTFDPSTYQAERLMYWPSHPLDQEPVLNVCEGPLLPVDEILGQYRDWRDASEWPVAERERDVIRRDVTKVGDPREKPGWVGAFCRAYSISEAIDKYLPDVYAPSAHGDGRYTYLHGSTGAGMIAYDDLLAYSHHGTDPIHGHACNAFDLVRLHIYGLRDERCDRDTPVVKRPSYEAMIEEVCRRDEAVKMEMALMQQEQVKAEFSVYEVDERGQIVEGLPWSTEEEKAQAYAWMQELDQDKKGKLEISAYNIEMIMRRDPLLKGKFGLNEFDHRLYVLGSLPWQRHQALLGSQWTDTDEACLRSYIETRYGIYHPGRVKDALGAVMRENAFHPVRAYLKRLVWDGTERVDTLFIDYLGAEDSSYVRAVARKFMAAAVARILQPGCKFDYAPVLVGAQGVGKSTLVAKLGGVWFSDNFHGVQGKEAIEQLHGAWIMEMGELAGLRKAEVEAVKAFISRQQDSYRPAYGVNVMHMPRQCVFIGTTNTEDFLKDRTGNRRFWPVTVEPDNARLSVHTDMDKDTVDQLWAEAVQIYKAGEVLHLPPDVEAIARRVQEDHTEVDPLEEHVIEYLEMDFPDNFPDMDKYERRAWVRSKDKSDVVTASAVVGPIVETSVAEIMSDILGLDKGQQDARIYSRISAILTKIGGWQKTKSQRSIAAVGRVRSWRKTG